MVHLRRKGATTVCAVLLLLAAVSSFQTPATFSSLPRHHQLTTTLHPQRSPHPQQTCGRDGSSTTSLHMFMGSDGGLLGIGTPELFTILLVGYFVLGPSDLYKLVKEVGKFIQNARTLGTEATKTFENTMESQLELNEIRKAQQELNDAFNFRRSINVDDTGEAFATKPKTYAEEVPEVPEAAAATATAAAAATAATADAAVEPPKPKKKKRRRIKKKVVEQPAPAAESIPDLDMTDAFEETTTSTTETTPPVPTAETDWFAEDSSNNNTNNASDEKKIPSVSEMVAEEESWLTADPAVTAAEQSRFQQQLSGTWNDKVLENEDQLAPLAMVMERLAILEEERAAAEKRLDDEFRERFQLEEEFYRKKRALLEESAAKVQQEAYVTMDSKSSDKS